jgi:hypothetical protein
MGISLAAFLAWRRRSRPEPDPPRVIPRLERSGPPVPAPYLSLYRYLDHRYASLVVLSFDQIEALLGSALPATARVEAGWWTVVGGPKSHSSAWTGAGRTAVPNLLAGTVAFERLS